MLRRLAGAMCGRVVDRVLVDVVGSVIEAIRTPFPASLLPPDVGAPEPPPPEAALDKVVVKPVLGIDPGLIWT